MGTTIVLGIPVPSTDPVFLGLVGVHIAFGLAAVANGVGAMLSAKGPGPHATFGRLYFWSLFGVVVTMSALAIQRWNEDRVLFFLGTLAFGCALAGRFFIRRRRPRPHLAGMASSFIVMLTAFYVDNGKNLPLWRDLPSLAYWIVPGAVGLPIVAYYLVRLPRFEFRKTSDR